MHSIKYLFTVYVTIELLYPLNANTQKYNWINVWKSKDYVKKIMYNFGSFKIFFFI